MKERLRLWYDQLFTPVRPLEPGLYTYQTPADAPQPYRLHLRVEPDGQGILIINASTVLHLNQTAVEYAYLMIQGKQDEDAARTIAQRYQVSAEQALLDFRSLSDRIQALIDTPDLDPVTFLDLERHEPYSQAISAPYRLDCALTYQVDESSPEGIAPVDRVKRELMTAEWKTILEKASAAGIPHVVFTGGEPTLRPDVPELILIAEGLGMVTGLITGGCRLSDTHYLHQILQAGLDHMMVVLSPEDEQCWESIRDAMAEDLFVSVHLTLTSSNRESIEEQLQRVRAIGVRSVSISAASEDLAPSLQVLRNRIAELDLALVWDLPVPYSAQHPVSYELEHQEEAVSGAGKAWLYVEPDGDVLPQQGDLRVLGNLITDEWSAIWSQAKQR